MINQHVSADTSSRQKQRVQEDDHENTAASTAPHNSTTQDSPNTPKPLSCPFAILPMSQSHPSPLLSSTSAESSPDLSYSKAHGNHAITAAQALQLAKESCPAFQSKCPFRDVQDEKSMRAALQSLPPSHLCFRQGGSGGGANSIDGDDEEEERGNKSMHLQENEIGEMVKVALAHVHAVSRHIDSAAVSISGVSAGGAAAGSGNEMTLCTDADVANGVRAPTSNLIPPPAGQALNANPLEGRNCPFKTQYGESTLFVDAMERFSLFGLMGKLIQEELGIVPVHEELHGSSGGNTHGTVNTVETVGVVSTSDSIQLDDPSRQHKQQPQLQQHQLQQHEGPESHASKHISHTIKRSGSATLLSQALKQGTKESHSAAESVHFVKEFIKGNIDRTLYSILICNLYHLYQELEQLLDQYAPKYFETLHFPKELKRTEALKDDLDFFQGERGLDGYCGREPSKATVDYIGRLRYIAEQEPILLLSHAYTRYLGDLSGGKILARVAKRALNLQQDDSGLKFYQFDEIPSAKLFKDRYRKALDELVLTEEQIERLVAEANVAFVLNMRIFEELDVLSEIEGAVVRDYHYATQYYDECVNRQQGGNKVSNDDVGHYAQGKESSIQEGGETKCPFAKLGGSNPHVLMHNRQGDDKDHKEIGKVGSKVFTEQTHTDLVDQTHQSQARCPWPFVFFHDPQTGMKDYQTWIVIGLILCYIWNVVQKRLDIAY